MRPGRHTSRLLLLWHVAAAVAVVASFAAPAAAQEAPDRADGRAATAAFSEDEVKAAFLYNFGNYVQWPVAGRASDTIDIAVLGAPAIAAELEQFVQGRTIQGMPVRVRRIRATNELAGDEVLFIGADENWRLAQLVDSVSTPTLIVTDAPDGLADGAMINFRVVDRRVRFEISVPRAQDAGLMLSSRLLSAALRVETTRRGMEEEPALFEATAFALAAVGDRQRRARGHA
jgi:hypothetical protein